MFEFVFRIYARTYEACVEHTRLYVQICISSFPWVFRFLEACVDLSLGVDALQMILLFCNFVEVAWRFCGLHMDAKTLYVLGLAWVASFVS